jgi:hypothetical protein
MTDARTITGTLRGKWHGRYGVWAALSTSGITGLQLPRRASHLTIAPDGDPRR